jgi:hypothetical protein
MNQVPGQTCPRCNIGGIHACPGRPLPPPTKEEEKRLTATLQKIFYNSAKGVAL